jgi:hypothetical protein
MTPRTMFAPGQQGDKPPKDGHYTPAPRARAPSDEAVIAAFKAGVPVAAIARRAGRTRRSIQCVLRKSGLRPNPHKRPSAAETGDATVQHQATSFRNQDIAFQQALTRAIASGDEMPPMVGVHKDKRPLTVRFVFEPVPHSSGCASPAGECADLAAPVHRPVRLEQESTNSEPATAAEIGDAEIA